MLFAKYDLGAGTKFHNFLAMWAEFLPLKNTAIFAEEGNLALVGWHEDGAGEKFLWKSRVWRHF